MLNNGKLRLLKIINFFLTLTGLGSIDYIINNCRRFKMKKFVIGALMLLSTAACANLSQYTSVSANATPKEIMRACLVNEANSKLQAGTLFNNTMSATADEMVNTCLKKLALQAAGISEESQSTAESIIANLKNLNSAINAQ